jgi:hypothetical protein
MNKKEGSNKGLILFCENKTSMPPLPLFKGRKKWQKKEWMSSLSLQRV